MSQEDIHQHLYPVLPLGIWSETDYYKHSIKIVKAIFI